ncbi:MAG: exo-alpha-sialidase, partial [bacterium]|nr:exo-alpha-sialidase [bacterium]
DLFVSGEDGYHTYRIPSLLVTKAGTVLAFCEGRKMGRGDSGDIELLVKRSEDGGETWSEQSVVWADPGNTCGNPCPVVDERTGRIVLLGTWNRGEDHGKQLHSGEGIDTRRVFVMASDDDGRTWSAAREITDATKAPEWWWYATGPGVAIQLRQGPHTGRLVVPANHSSAEHGFAAHTIYSDDGGETWRRSNPIAPACNESQVVELGRGRLMMNMRSQSFTNEERTGYRSIAFSSDGGETWSAPEFDKHLGDPQVQASLVRYDADHLLFSNPSPPIQRERGQRIDLTVRLSYDDGETWPVARLVHPGPSAYSSLTRLPDGRIGLLYEGGAGKRYDRLILARFPLDWLTGGEDGKE